jgi:putative ABC transport system permease protein
MLKNFIIITLRNLQRNLGYSFINIFGLAIGLTCSILILLWVADEFKFDKFHTKRDQLFKVLMNQEFSEGIGTQHALPYPLHHALKQQSSSIKYTVITNWGEGNMLTAGETKITKVGISASEDFLKMFSFDVVKGDPSTALSDPSSIVLTEATAQALFGTEDPIGQFVKVDSDKELKVSAIIKDVPEQSSITFTHILPFAFFESTQEWVRNSKDNWGNNSFQMYIELFPESNAAEVESSIKNIVKTNLKDANTNPELLLQPITNLRLYSNFKNGKPDGGMIEYVKLFTAIAVFVLIIACINFMNLATARSEKRAREVGIRKSIGSRKRELILQFLGESIFITLIAFLLAVILVEISLPFYNELVNKKLAIDYSNPSLWIASLAIILLTGIIAGSYPAFYLSSFKPATVLKGKMQGGKGGSLPRKVLVTLQFGFSIFLIIGTVVIYQQILHVKDRETGYDKENLMMVWTNSELEKNYQPIKNELINTGVVQSVCKSNSPVTSIFSNNFVEWPGMAPGTRVVFTTIATEYDYTKTMGVKILEGRDFSPEFNDSSKVVVNKAAVETMGLKNPIGEKLNMWGGEWEIIGVTENIIMGSPYEPVAPMVIVYQPGWTSTITLRLGKTDDLSVSIAQVENVFKKLNPTYPFAYRFADVEFDKKFSSINLISNLARIFASLALIITVLGLFGLAAFTAEQRTKEIGIRKVLGASVSSVVMLLSKDFTRLVIVAFVLASPLAWWLLNSYLEQYAYRITINWLILPISGLFALIIAVLIVSTQAIRAAVANPVKSLRNE